MYASLFFCQLGIFLSVVNAFSEKLSGESVLYGIASLTENFEKDEMTTCSGELNVLYRAVEERHVWALKVLDASGQPETGFLYGNNLWLGARTHCLDIPNQKPLEINHQKVAHPPPTAFDYPPFSLKFIKAFIKHNNTLQFHTQMPFDFTIQVGLCVPRSCSNRDLFHLFRVYLQGHYLNVQQLYNLNLNVERVKTLEEDAVFILYSPKFVLLMVIFGMILVPTVLGTIYDMKQHYRDKKYLLSFQQNIGKIKEKTVSEVELVKASQESLGGSESRTLEILKCFSLYSNVKTLLSVRLSPGSITCIHGIRFFGMLWVCTIHSIFFQADYVRNVPYAYRISEDFASQVMSNSTYSVDTFLFISGFLLAYLYYKTKKMVDGPVSYSGKIYEFIMMFLHRVVRLSPPYIIVILISDVLYTYLRRTSSLESSEQPDIMCARYWWRNLLYINNLFPRNEMCLSWSWYLSLDTQAFVITSSLIIVSTFAFKTATMILFFLMLCSILVTSYKSYSIGYIPTMDEQLMHLDDIYDLPWNRIGPYLIGAITGYLLVKKLKFQLILGKLPKAILWIIFPSINLWILFALHTRQLSVEFSAVYMGISRTLWGVGMAWFLIACCTGNGITLNKFLSFRGWIPLSRLTFCAYLLNPLVANAMYMGAETPMYASKAGFAINILGVTLSTFFWAFVVSIFFESPFILLTKILLRRRAEKPSKTEISTIPEKP
ncbi:nose resistant to fluoxetine protein 6-like [Coccinella septempunctata]|uniref:nose resistant to fluoxetine protein 6-like n=1 Tax=Coccinella septempunctata TaxID=41139 RepID=UPI001D06E54B|nr:nose resistant to fluoxetine protein 6-like [Coccinella septempunctata]